jgi:hypothetical protein
MPSSFGTAGPLRHLRASGALRALLAVVAGFILLGASPAGASVTAPGAPTDISAQPGYDAALLTWEVPANGGAPITSFVIKTLHEGTVVNTQPVTAGAVGSLLDPTPGAIDSFNVTGLTGETDIDLTVAAVNSMGTGTTSPDSETFTPSSTPAAPYEVLRFSVNTSTPFDLSLRWFVPPNNGEPITSFAFQVVAPGEDAAFSVPVGAVGSALDPTPGAVDTYTIGNQVPGAHTVELAATNSVGTGLSVSQPGAVTGPYFSTTTTQVNLGDSTLGDYVGPQVVELDNVGTTEDHVTNITFSGTGADDYGVDENCGNVAPGGQCPLEVAFSPGALGSRPATMTVDDESFNSITVSLTGTGSTGYYEFGSLGEVAAFGDAGYYGNLGSITLNKPIVGMSPTGNDGGYWLVASDGGIFSFGDARFHGSTGAIVLNQPIVGMATTPDGAGYWLVAADGGIFAFGDARFFGSVPGVLQPGQVLDKPIVGMAATTDGKGYWLVASDGGIFAFGDARFHGSVPGVLQPGQVLDKPIVGMAATPDGQGYWMVASDGGIFAFGDARFHGSTGGQNLPAPIVGMSPMADGNGYWLAGSDGSVYNFGDAPNYGSVAGQGVTDAIGIATDSPPTVQAINDEPADRHGLTHHAEHSMVSPNSEQSRFHQW